MVYHPEIDRFRALPDTPVYNPDLIKDVSLTFKEGGSPSQQLPNFQLLAMPRLPS